MIRPELSTSRVLIVGGAGFIGSHLVDRLCAMGAPAVVVLDNLFLGTEQNLEGATKSDRFHFYRDDAEFPGVIDHILQVHQIDVVINCATKALNYSFTHPALAFHTNVVVVLNLLEALRLGKFATLAHFSSSEVYGSALYVPMDEDHPRHPTTTYAAGKAAADLALESYVRMFDLDAFVVRPFNNYGPRQNSRGELAGVIPATVLRILNDQKPQLHGDGTQTRDFVFVNDTVDAAVKVFDKLERGDSVNIATGGQLSINEVISTICLQLGYDGGIDQRPPREADVLQHCGSNKKIKSMIDLSETQLKDGLRQTLDWYRKMHGETGG